MHEMNIFQLIKKETALLADKIAVVEGEKTISYGRLVAQVEHFARTLKSKGIQRFHRVGFICPNSIDYILVSLAVLSLDAVIVPLSPEHTQEEIEDVVHQMDTEFVITTPGAYQARNSEPLELDGLHRLDIIRHESQRQLPQEYYDINPAFIRFSSGTTGDSKGVALSHESIMERTDLAGEGMRITSSDNIGWILSMSFHFVVTILLFLRRGATIAILNHPFEESLIAAMQKMKLTVLYASPFHYDVFTKSAVITRESFGSVRLAISTAIKLPQEIYHGFKEKFGFKLTEAYGIIEVGLPFIAAGEDYLDDATLGPPLPGYQVAIHQPDESGVGEILLKGKGMLDAYFHPWRGRRQALMDGWFNTGDLGRLDDTGALTIVGRKKNVINFAGMKVFPEEVESVINQHPQVVESMVYGEPHGRFGHLPVAWVVARDGHGDKLDVEDLRAHCYRRLARYKAPKSFEVVSDIPKTKSGKIIRRWNHG